MIIKDGIFCEIKLRKLKPYVAKNESFWVVGRKQTN